MKHQFDIDIAQARRIATDAAGLGRGFPPGAEGVDQAIRHLSAVQIDTISVVERAHHHILWARVPRYKKTELPRLEAEPRRIIEYWSHAAAYLPLTEYRYCIPRMRRVREQGHDWFEADQRTVELVRRRIAEEGALRVQDFEGPRRTGAGWWDWKPAKVALEFLFHSGELISLGREGFQKRYDLAERALPAGLDLRPPNSEEMAAYYVDVAVRTLGIFTESDVAYGRKDMLEDIPDEIAHRVESGRLVGLRLEGEGSKRIWYAAPECLGVERGDRGPARVFALSPFDPLIIDRRRTKRLFGVEFLIECYLPSHKRRFGYFALPLLFRESSGELSFVGRLDAKADRASGLLILRKLSVTGVKPRSRRSLAAALSREIARYASFNGCGGWKLEILDSDDDRLSDEIRVRLRA